MIGFVYAFVAMIGFSLNQIFNKKLTLKLNSYNAFLAREIYLVLLLFIATLFIGNFTPINIKTLGIIIIGGFFGMIAFSALLKSFSHLPLGITITVANMFPFVTLFLSIIFYSNYPSVNQFAIMILVLLGIVITVYKKSKTKISDYKTLILPLITAFGWGIYFLCIYSLTKQNLNPFNLSLYLELATLIFLITYILLKNNFDKNIFSKTNFTSSFLAGTSSLIALITSVYAMNANISPAVVSSILSAQLIVITLLSIPIFKEKITTRQFIGILIVLAGLILYNFT